MANVNIECGYCNMSFELLISFVSPDHDRRPIVKRHVMEWLDAKGRRDFVEGVIDGVDIKLTQEESDSATTTDDRLSEASIALFDAFDQPLIELIREMKDSFAPEISLKLTEISDESWMQCWNDDFSALQTEMFWIAPLGDGSKTPEGLIRVEIDSAGGAFGTGQHTTTRAIIRVMEEFFPKWNPESVLDVGTGTGIYLILAGKMGVRSLAGTEISNDLVELARANCDGADVVADIRLSERPIFGREFDVIIANILVPVLHDLMGDLQRHLSRRGRLIVAGFIEKEEAPLVALAKKNGLAVEYSTSEMGWRCLVFIRA